VPMKPGYYHLLIDNGPGVPLTVTVIEGAGGEFCEPTSRIFEKLGAGDMREQRNLDRFARTEPTASRASSARRRETATSAASTSASWSRPTPRRRSR
jgi:hypothetical protein